MTITSRLKLLKIVIFIASAFRGQIKKQEYAFDNILLSGYYSLVALIIPQIFQIQQT